MGILLEVSALTCLYTSSEYLYRGHFWPGWRQGDCCCEVRSVCSPEGGFAYGIFRILIRERGHFGGLLAQKILLDDAKLNRTIKHDFKTILQTLMSV